METYCDSSGDNNEGSVKVLAFQSLAAEVLHNNACISASGRFKKEAKDCQNQRPTNKNVSSQPSSPSLSSREESTSGSFPRNHVTSAVKGQSYNRFGRRSVVGISGASSELAGISNPQDSPDCPIIEKRKNGLQNLKKSFFQRTFFLFLTTSKILLPVREKTDTLLRAATVMQLWNSVAYPG